MEYITSMRNNTCPPIDSSTLHLQEFLHYKFLRSLLCFYITVILMGDLDQDTEHRTCDFDVVTDALNKREFLEEIATWH